MKTPTAKPDLDAILASLFASGALPVGEPKKFNLTNESGFAIRPLAPTDFECLRALKSPIVDFLQAAADGGMPTLPTLTGRDLEFVLYLFWEEPKSVYAQVFNRGGHETGEFYLGNIDRVLAATTWQWSRDAQVRGLALVNEQLLAVVAALREHVASQAKEPAVAE